MKIVAYEMEDWERQAFERMGNHEIVYENESVTEENASIHSDAEIISVFIYSRLNGDILSRFKKLKLIVSRSTGVDHIDKEYCKEHGITVCNVPTYGKNTVAEHAFGLILTISHNIYDGVARTRDGKFSFEGLRGFDLLGKTLGVIGTGDIGEYVIKIANGFNMQVLAYDVKPKTGIQDKLKFEYVDFDKLLSTADIITVHVPGIPQTRNMISKGEFDKMKKGVVFINTSRGTVVNVEALVEALQNGTVAAAGMDVLEKEPVIHEEAELMRSVYSKEHRKELSALLADNVLLKLKNVYITPHSAFNTKEAMDRILDTTIENIEMFLQGTPQNVK